VLGRIRSLRNHGQDSGHFPAQQRGCVEPDTREDRAAKDSVFSRSDLLKLLVTQEEPVDLVVEHANRDIFTYAVSTVDIEFLVQVVAHAAGGDFRDQVRGAIDLAIVIGRHIAAILRLDEQLAVGLTNVAQVWATGAIVAAVQFRRPSLVMPVPIEEVMVMPTVERMSDG
jgi:hypothetical protein